MNDFMNDFHLVSVPDKSSKIWSPMGSVRFVEPVQYAPNRNKSLNKYFPYLCNIVGIFDLA